jgi:hypothetical protein
MFAAISKDILKRVVTGILITGFGVHTGFRAHDGSPKPCTRMPHIRRVRGKNIYEKK